MAVSAAAGYVLLLAITYALPPIADILDAEGAGTPSVAYTLIQNLEGFATFLCFVIVIAMMLCGLSAVASTGRMIDAFARDRGLPASGFFGHVSPHFRTPDVAIVPTGVLAVLICVYAYSTDDVIGSIALITGMSTNLLYWVYGIPILLGLRADALRWRSVWALDERCRLVAVVALGWIAVISVLSLWWPNNRYAATRTFWFGVLLVDYYVARAGRNFKAPQGLQTDDLLHRERLVDETMHGETGAGMAPAD